MSDNSTTNIKEISPLKSEAPIIIYIDLKSPYAYLSITPTRQMLTQLGLIADWRPFVLDIPSYLGSAKLDRGGKKVTKQNRTEEQWSGVKYAYFDCRRYANLSNKTIRGTVKIWNTDLPAIGMLWLKSFADLEEQSSQGSMLERYIDAIFEPFWKRELDVEDLSVILRVLEQIDAPTDGFLPYAQGEGATLNTWLQESAFNKGIFGVPTFILPNEPAMDPQHEKFFGREHLPRISWLLDGRKGPAPDVAYHLNSEVDDEALAKCAAEPRMAPELLVTPPQLTTFFDFKSPQSYLALQGILALKGEGISVNWRPFVSKPLKVPEEEVTYEDRSTQHRRIRGEYHANDIKRYASHDLTNIYRETDCQFADMGLLWLQREVRASNDAIDDYVQQVFIRLWQEEGEIDSPQDIEPLFLATKLMQDEFDKAIQDGRFIDGWQKYVGGKGIEHLDGAREAAQSQSISTAPTFLLGSEPFQGHSQLPLIKARLKAGI
jgi:2-hydroxychromene-2-carboxylate isomerase